MFGKLLLVLMGFLAFSPFYTHYPRPYNTIELYIILFCILYFRKLNFKDGLASIPLYAIAFLILFEIGMLYMSANGLLEYYRMDRQWLLIFLFAYIFYKSPLIRQENMFWLSFGAILGSACMALGGIESLEEKTQTAYLCPNIIAIPIFTYLSFHKGVALKIITFILVFTMGAFSQTRGIFIYCVIAYIISYLVHANSSGKILFDRNVVLVIVGFALLYVIYVNVEDFVYETNQYLHYRLYDKVENMGAEETDQYRIKCYLYYVDNFPDYILPHGFYLRRGAKEWDIRDVWPGVNDSGYLELIHTFGWMLFGVIASYYIRKVRDLMRKRKRQLPDAIETDTLFVTSLFVPIALLMGYAIFMAPYTACFWGMFIAMMKTSTNQILYKREK